MKRPTDDGTRCSSTLAIQWEPQCQELKNEQRKQWEISLQCSKIRQGAIERKSDVRGIFIDKVDRCLIIRTGRNRC